MKFIHLSKKQQKTPYDMIIKHGCGPNYVLKREDKFRKMIEEQGETFWFRFWFTVFYNPTCDYFRMIEESFPIMMNNVHKYCHFKFLQVSTSSAADYCVNLIRSLKILPEEKRVKIDVKENNVDLQRLQDEILTAANVSFGVSLCVVFYYWLKSDDTNSNAKNYWMIPPEYLDPQFEPGLLEKFLANVWKEKLPILLGEDINNVPWLKEHVRRHEQMKKSKKDPVHNHVLTECIRDTAEELRTLQNENLQAVLAAEGDVRPSRSRRSNKKRTKQLYLDVRYLKCSNCSAVASRNDKFAHCLKCIEENWPNPKFYCSINCQVKHWYNSHLKEHVQYKQDKICNDIEQEMLGGFRIIVRRYIFVCLISILVVRLFPSIIDYCSTIFNAIADNLK